MTTFTEHCLERSASRSIPTEVIERAMENPFLSGDTRHNRKWGVVNAVIDGAWRFVVVLWEVRGWTKLAITAYVPNREQILALSDG